ncbi:SsrA-binding protein SmpB [Candidatus Saccharibacteria bacterium]|nr:SsrA-binding protein SmpB [Candidatus Saccharibacteria bacterium]
MKSKVARKAARKQISEKVIRNKRARFDYELGDSFVVGIALNGRETKSLRLGHGQLLGSYVTVKDNELWLLNATIHGTNGIPIDETEQTRTRKLLAKRREIDLIISAKNQGLTIVPTEILTKGRFIKLRIALGKGRRQYDKRQVLKKRTAQTEAKREIKHSTDSYLRR